MPKVKALAMTAQQKQWGIKMKKRIEPTAEMVSCNAHYMTTGLLSRVDASEDLGMAEEHVILTLYPLARIAEFEYQNYVHNVIDGNHPCDSFAYTVMEIWAADWLYNRRVKLPYQNMEEEFRVFIKDAVIRFCNDPKTTNWTPKPKLKTYEVTVYAAVTRKVTLTVQAENETKACVEAQNDSNEMCPEDWHFVDEEVYEHGNFDIEEIKQ